VIPMELIDTVVSCYSVDLCYNVISTSLRSVVG